MVKIATTTAVLLALASAPSALAAEPTEYDVSSTADGNPGNCAAPVGATETCTTLRAALLAIDHNNAAHATISLGPGRYVLGGAGGSDAPLLIEYPTTIIGAGADRTSVVQTDGKDAVFETYDTAGNTTIEDLEITGGAQGGISSEAGLTLDGDLIEGNHLNGVTTPSGGEPVEGGGIDNQSQSLPMNIVSSSVLDNQVTGGTGPSASGSKAGGEGGVGEGGGIFTSSPTTVTDSTIAGNTVTGGDGGTAQNATAGDGGEAFGGGIEAVDGLVLNRVTVDDNRVTGGAGGSTLGTGDGGSGELGLGGGVDVQPASGITNQIVNSTITGNTASPGPAGSSLNGGANGFTGSAAGGGLSSEGGTTTLASVTLAANTASAGAGGNLSLVNHNGAAVVLSDSILAGGTGIAGAGNCGLPGASSIVDDGSNLEDSGAGTSECDLSASRDHLVAAGDAGVAAALAANGGPTETLALLAGSPALGDGGACTDPTSGGAPLLEDQRGLPRPSGGPCDIGAFQAQAVKAGEAKLSGTPGSGHTMTCTAIGFAGDISDYTYRWSLGSKVLAGATGSPLRLTFVDSGLSLGCRVTALGARGSASAVSPFVTVTEPGVPTVSSKKVAVSNSGRLTLEIACPRGSQPCTAALKLSAVGRHGAKLTTGAFSIRAGHTAAVKLKLGGSGLKRFKREHGLKAVAAVSYWHLGKYVTVSTKLTLVAPSKRRSRR